MSFFFKITCTELSVFFFLFFLSYDLFCRNGDKYAGEYYGDKIHGFGVYHFANGHYYEGAWHEGRKQGYGTYGFKTGDAKCGEWDDGHLVNRLPLETGSVHKAVQVNIYIYMMKLEVCRVFKMLLFWV